MIQKIGLGLFIVLIVLLGFMQPGIRLAGMQVIAGDIVFPVTFLFVIAWAIKQRTLESKSFLGLLLLYLISTAASATLSLDQHASVIKLVGITYLAGLALIASIIVTDRSILKIIVLVWIGTSAFVSILACFAIIAFYTIGPEWAEPLLHHYGSLIPGNYPRVQSTFIYPAMLCNYLTVGALLTLAAGRAGWIGRKLKYGLFTVHFIALSFTLTPGLGGFVAALLFWAAYFVSKARLISRPLILAGTVAAVAAVVVSAFSIFPIETSPYVFTMFGHRVDPTQRLLTWQGGLETFFRFPFFGKGVGLPAANVIFKSPSGMQMLTDAHQTAISILALGGIFAFATFSALVIYVLRVGRKSLNYVSEIDAVRVALWLAFLSGMIVQGSVGSFEDSRHLWILMGLIVAAERISKQGDIKIQTPLEEEPRASHQPNAI